MEKLFAIDVFPNVLYAAKNRLGFHNKDVDCVLINEKEGKVRLPPNLIDYIYTFGVLHHCANSGACLYELCLILKKRPYFDHDLLLFK
jgi:hypothetical protein